MKDFFGRLAQRAIAASPAVRPRYASPFEQNAVAMSPSPEEFIPPPEPETRLGHPARDASISDSENVGEASDVREKPDDTRPGSPATGSRPAPRATPDGGTSSKEIAPVVRLDAATDPRPTGISEPVDPVRTGAMTPLGDEAATVTRVSMMPLEASREPPDVKSPLTVGAKGQHRAALLPLGTSGPESASATEIKTPDHRPPTKEVKGVAPLAGGSRVLRPHIRLAGAPTNGAAASLQPPEDSVGSSPPDVHITIGRLEIRAVPQPIPTRTASAPVPRLSLDDYLKKSAGGEQ